jgi:hypothetical protein
LSETWKPIVGYEGLYEVSDLGRVRGVDRIDASGYRRKGKILRGGTTPKGYRIVALFRDSIRKDVSVHDLVLTAFTGPRPPGLVAAHGNGVHADNRAVNLRWTTQSDNLNDRYLHGTDISGDKHYLRRRPELRLRREANPHSKLTEGTVERMFDLRAAGVKLKEIASYFDISWKYVSRVLCNHSCWSHA